MRKSKHLVKRMQQRGICHDAVLLIAMFGEEIRSEQGCVKLKMTEKTIRKLIQLLDKCRNTVVLANNEVSTLITAYSCAK